jgi:nucleotide-binding universal stress UspA family protein
VYVVMLVVAWIAIGLVTAVMMARRGYALGPWVALGLAFGPFSVVLAFEDVRSGIDRPARELRPGSVAAGPVDVLAGLDGSREATQALVSAVELLDDRLGRLALATVVDLDATAEIVDRARRAIDDAAGHVVSLDPAVVVLYGNPAEALAEHAYEEGYQLLVIGRHGRGLSNALLGSVSRRLVHRAGIPLLLGGSPAHSDQDRPRRGEGEIVSLGD